MSIEVQLDDLLFRWEENLPKAVIHRHLRYCVPIVLNWPTNLPGGLPCSGTWTVFSTRRQ